MLLNEQRVRTGLNEAFPSLDVRSARYFASGWDYELWEINDDLLARFPLRDECAAGLKVEARLLEELSKHVSTPIPTPLHYSDGTPSFPQPFFTYRKLGGVPLIDVSNDKALLDVAGREIGAFLRELHAFPRDRAAALGVPSYTPESWRAFYRGFRAQCDARIGPLLNNEERSAVDRFWTSFLNDDANFRFTPALVHADLGPDHVLVDPDDGHLAGVIDFGDARVGDPAIDFTGLLRLQDALLAGYGRLPDETFLRRARIYWQIGPFHEVLYGLEIESKSHVRAGLSGIRERAVAAAPSA